MKEFKKKQLRQALTYAMEGGQALHIHNIIANPRRAPACFKRAIRNNEAIAHLFDQDRDRLIATAKKLGVRKILVEREGLSTQHIDLCGSPLANALLYHVSEKEELS